MSQVWIEARQASLEVRLEGQERHLGQLALAALNVELNQVVQGEIVANDADRQVYLAARALVAERAQHGVDHVQRLLLPTCAVAGRARQKGRQELKQEVGAALRERSGPIGLGEEGDAGRCNPSLLSDHALKWIGAAGEVAHAKEIVLAAETPAHRPQREG